MEPRCCRALRAYDVAYGLSHASCAVRGCHHPQNARLWSDHDRQRQVWNVSGQRPLASVRAQHGLYVLIQRFRAQPRSCHISGNFPVPPAQLRGASGRYIPCWFPVWALQNSLRLAERLPSQKSCVCLRWPLQDRLGSTAPLHREQARGQFHWYRAPE